MLFELTDRARKYIALDPKLGRREQLSALLRRDPSVVILSMLALNLLRLISSLILTRLMAPADFGVAGIITLTQYVLIMLFDVGFDALVIRHQDIQDQRFFDVVWTIRFAQSIFLAIVMSGSAHAVANFLRIQVCLMCLWFQLWASWRVRRRRWVSALLLETNN